MQMAAFWKGSASYFNSGFRIDPERDVAGMEKNCNACGGTGQISFFQGVSRFLLTVEECPECAGTGRQLEPDTAAHQEEKGKAAAKQS